MSNWCKKALTQPNPRTAERGPGSIPGCWLQHREPGPRPRPRPTINATISPQCFSAKHRGAYPAWGAGEPKCCILPRGTWPRGGGGKGRGGRTRGKNPPQTQLLRGKHPTGVQVACSSPARRAVPPPRAERALRGRGRCVRGAGAASAALPAAGGRERRREEARGSGAGAERGGRAEPSRAAPLAHERWHRVLSFGGRVLASFLGGSGRKAAEGSVPARACAESGRRRRRGCSAPSPCPRCSYDAPRTPCGCSAAALTSLTMDSFDLALLQEWDLDSLWWVVPLLPRRGDTGAAGDVW